MNKSLGISHWFVLWICFGTTCLFGHPSSFFLHCVLLSVKALWRITYLKHSLSFSYSNIYSWPLSRKLFCSSWTSDVVRFYSILFMNEKWEQAAFTAQECVTQEYYVQSFLGPRIISKQLLSDSRLCDGFHLCHDVRNMDVLFMKCTKDLYLTLYIFILGHI